MRVSLFRGTRCLPLGAAFERRVNTGLPGHGCAAPPRPRVETGVNYHIIGEKIRGAVSV